MFTRVTVKKNHGWATVTVYRQSGAIAHRSKVRDTERTLQALTEACKGRGAAYVTWGAVRSDMWVGVVKY